MSRPRGRRAAFVAATVLTAGLALAGCSAGAVTQTDTALSGAPGSFGSADQMLVRDMTLDAGPSQVVPAGATVGLLGTIVNEAGTSDRLVSVTTPYAQTVTVEGSTTIPGDNAVRLVGSRPGPIPAVAPDVREAAAARIVLRGVTQVLRPGPTYTITLNFEKAGPLTVPVIVGNNDGTAGSSAG